VLYFFSSLPGVPGERGERITHLAKLVEFGEIAIDLNEFVKSY
jgi:hypothetical protein